MTDTTPTALTPEGLATELDRSAEILGHDTGALIRTAAHVVRAQKLHTDRVDAKLVEQARQIEAQRAEIERLKEQNTDLEKAALTAYESGVEHAFEAAQARAITAEAALSASLERERGMREALTMFTKSRYQITDRGPANTWSLDRLHEAWVKACDCLSPALQEDKP